MSQLPTESTENAQDLGKYLLHSSVEIRQILKTLASRGALVTAYYNDGRDSFLTSVVGVDQDRVYLDSGQTESINRSVGAARHFIVTTALDKIKIQFSLSSLKSGRFENRNVFSAVLPDEMLRLQRREFYRLETPVSIPLKLQIPGRRIAGQATVVDISGGGVGVVIPSDPDLQMKVGLSIDGCKIDLPQEGMLVANLCIRNRFQASSSRSGTGGVRLGMEFVDLPAAELMRVQRFITRIERERRAREKEKNSS